jgi:hypothetical protein
VADGHKKPFCRDLLLAAGSLAGEYARNSGVIPQYLVDLGVEDQADLALRDPLHQLVLHDLLGAEFVTPVHELDALRDVGEVERLLDGGIAAADHRPRPAPCRRSRRRWRRPRRRGP